MTLTDPEVGWEPAQDPLPEHAVAFWLLQVRVALWPGDTELGLTEMLIVAGAPGGVKTAAEVELRLQPERTRTYTVRSTSRNRAVPGNLGKCIEPPC